MATSRTGTARYKRNSARTLHAAQARGLTHCPCTSRRCKTHTGKRCNVPLDYVDRKRPNGASIEHIKAWITGGTDEMDNLTVICLKCNETLGDKRNQRTRQTVTSYTPTAPRGAQASERRPGRPPTPLGAPPPPPPAVAPAA